MKDNPLDKQEDLCYNIIMKEDYNVKSKISKSYKLESDF